MNSVAVILPTLNASRDFPRWLAALKSQTIAPDVVIVIDSSSSDDTLLLAQSEGLATFSISREEFNHGATRQLGLSLAPEAEILVYLTQDAILAGADALEKLIGALADAEVGAAYGRQLPRNEAGPLEAHARFFNYPCVPQVRALSDRTTLGFKTIFISNSFAAYRRAALEQVGGFPNNVIMGEDTCVAGKMLLSGWKLAYVSCATVYHSHHYSLIQEFRRYFDVGVLHAREPWLLQQFGKAAGEGRKYLLSEVGHLWPKHRRVIPVALMRNFLKLAGYRLGRLERHLTPNLKRELSMHASYWTRSRE